MDVRIGQARQQRATSAVDGGHVVGELADSPDAADAATLDKHVMTSIGFSAGGVDDGHVADHETIGSLSGHRSAYPLWANEGPSC